MIGEVTFGVIGLLFLFADIRTFTSTFQQTFFGQSTTTLAVLATSAFATSFLGLLVVWRLGPIRALGTSGAVLGVATFLLTASRQNWVDLGLSAIALAAGFWWLAILHAARPLDRASPLARALPIAFAADLALRAAFRTVAVPDLAWPAAVGIALVATLVFAASGLTALAAERRWASPGARGLVALAAVPCLFLVAETGGTNGAQIAAAAGLGLGPEAPRATQIGQLVAGIGIAAGAIALSMSWRRGIAAAAAVALGAALVWAHLPLVSLVGGAALSAGGVLAASVLLGAPLRPARSPRGTILALSFGWLLFVAAAFGFYAFWAWPPAVWAATGIVVLATLAAPGGAGGFGRPIALAVVALAIVVPFAATITTPTVTAEPLRRTFRMMTYNVHQGFSAGQIPSFDELVAAISAERPDVVCLQEVVRGFMVDEQHDALSILAERLQMSYVFLPVMGDLYGDAILTRAPVGDVRRLAFAREPGAKHQPRGALFATLGDAQSGRVLVICTHLDDVLSSVRQEQARAIIREWDPALPAVLAGDLNGEPDSPELGVLRAAGFADLGAPAGPTTTGDDPGRRIDFVLGRGVVGSQAHAPAAEDAVGASDHRWLVVNITWGQ